MGEALGKQRTQRAVDQPAQQCFRLARAPLAAEEVARYLAGCITLFLVVDREREEVATFHRVLVTDDRCKHHCLAHADDNGTALAGDFPGF